MTDEIVNYAFISYKRIEPDETWAKNLHRLLNSWYIPTDIAYSERLNNNKRISPIVRDKDNFPPGNGLDETIKTALRQSRSLILILSKAMIEDQMARRSKGEHAYIFEEIEYFQSLERSQRSIIPVYIDSDNQNPSELLPPMLKGYDKLILNVNDYFQTSKRQWSKRVAAAVAAGIFQKDQGLFWDYHRKAVRKSRIKIASIILLVFIFFVGLPLLLLLNQQRVRTRIAESYGLIEQSRQARKAHDTQAALIFALEAYEKSPDLDAALSNLRQQAIPNKHEPRTFLAGSSTISSNGEELITYNWRNQTVSIRDIRDLSVIETIGGSFLTIWRMSFSPDSRIVGLLGGDSLWIYNRDMHKYIYAERHRHHLIVFYGSYKTLFSPVDNYYLQMLGDYIIRLNVETKHTDTLRIGAYINDVQQVEDDLFLGISDSTKMGIYHFDYRRLKLTPVFVIPRQVRGNWTFHAQSSQIAYEVNDSIYRESPRGKIFCGVGTIKSFESDGNRLLWQKKYPEDNSIVLTDSNGYRNVKRFWNDDRLHTVYWGRNDENILLMYDDYIQIIESKYPYQERDKLILPRKHNYHISFLWSDSLFAITSPYALQDDIGYISYDYLAHNVNLKRPIYTLDGRMCLYERDDIEKEVVCTRTQDDSIVWHIAAYPAGSLTHKGWISPNRKRCALAHKLHYDEKYRVSRIVGIKIVDVSSGNVLFEKDSASFERFLSDDIFAYVNHDSVFIADVKTKHELYWGRDESGLDKWLQRGCQCAEDNDRICRITNLSGVQVYDFSTKNQLLNIPLSIDDISSIALGISPSGELLFVNQLFMDDNDNRRSFSKIAIWDVINKKMLFEVTLDELYFGGLITDNGYLLLKAWDRIALYNISSRTHIATMRFPSRRPLNIVQLNNTHVLINFPNAVVLEIDLKKGKIVEEKEYPDGIGEKIIGGHYIMSGNSLIDLNTDKIVLQLNKSEDNTTRDYIISIQDSIMLIDRTIDNRESREMIIPFEDEEALVRRVRQIVGQRVLSPHERAQYRE